jgi:integrase
MLDKYYNEELEKARIIYAATNAKSTVTQYSWQLKEYFSWLIDNKTSDNPNKLVSEYINYKIKTRDWSKRLVNIAYFAIKKYYEKVVMVPMNKKFFTNFGKLTKSKPIILTEEQVQKLLDNSEQLGEMGDAMLHVGYEGAMRAGELVLIRGNDVVEGNITCKVLKARVGKTKSFLPTLSTQIKVESLLERRSHKKYLFTTMPKSYEIHSNQRRFLSGEWSALFSEYSTKILGFKVRWHDFARHTRLTHFAKKTKNFMEVLLLSGHTNPKSALGYFENAQVEIPEIEVIK